MTFVEIGSSNNETELTQRQRWSVYISFVVIILGFYLGYLMKENSVNQVSLYTNVEAGISAQYPYRWLLDEEGNYIFRVRDMSHRGFKTVIEVSILPVSDDTVERNLLDKLSLSRSQTFIDYNVLGYDDFMLPDETNAIAMSYTYISRDASPFLEGVPAIVVGQDILTIQRGQALVITLRADSNIFELEYDTFERFLENLDF